MVLSPTRRSSDAQADARAAARSDAREILRQFLARPTTGVFLVVPLFAAFLGIGTPTMLLTLSGVAALWLAIDLLLGWARRPVPAEAGAYLNLLAWTAGLGFLAAASWTPGAFEFHGEVITLVAAVTAVAVGLGSQRSVAVAWAVAGATAVALGASFMGPLTGTSAIAASAVAVGTWFGAAIGVVVDRVVPASRARVQRPTAAPVSTGASVRKPKPADSARLSGTQSG
jgi:hypothetical protein